MTRNRYLDLLRVGAIAVVVLGHWLLTDVTYSAGQLSGIDVLDYLSWARWLTLPLQVMPVFFVVGGYVNAASWITRSAAGDRWADWVRHRALRLLWPTTIYAAAVVLAVLGATVAGANPAEIAQAAWLVALQLWFLPVYLLLIALTPAMLAAHRRWGLAVPAVMAALAAVVDVAIVGPHLPVIGFANYLLVWGSMHQWGFAWRDGTLRRPTWLPYALAGGGAAALAALLTWSPFPVNMIGAAGQVQNTSPPSVALLALAATQAGLLIAAEPAGQRLLSRRRRWRVVSRLNDASMTVYLWHMVPVIVVAVALYPRGLLPQPGIGSLAFLELRPAWLAILTVVLIPLTIVMMRLDRPVDRLPANGAPPVPADGRAPGAGARSGRPWSQSLLGAGALAAMVSLVKMAIGGFAPGGGLPLLALSGYAAGVLAVYVSGWLARPARGRASRIGDQVEVRS